MKGLCNSELVLLGQVYNLLYSKHLIFVNVCFEVVLGESGGVLGESGGE